MREMGSVYAWVGVQGLTFAAMSVLLLLLGLVNSNIAPGHGSGRSVGAGWRSLCSLAWYVFPYFLLVQHINACLRRRPQRDTPKRALPKQGRRTQSRQTRARRTQAMALFQIRRPAGSRGPSRACLTLETSSVQCSARLERSCWLCSTLRILYCFWFSSRVARSLSNAQLSFATQPLVLVRERWRASVCESCSSLNTQFLPISSS